MCLIDATFKAFMRLLINKINIVHHIFHTVHHIYLSSKKIADNFRLLIQKQIHEETLTFVRLNLSYF